MVNEHADAVVVGSGFGGSVAAYRLAAAGLSVVVLERGRPYPPGSFPRTPAQMGTAFWDPKDHLYGMYDVWSFSGCDSVVASGLGGGSLIYANVLLRKDERWFVHEEPLGDGGYESWPVTRAELDPHYDTVERMLGATPYPFDHPAYAHTPKTIAMRDAAMELGLDWRLPPLAISFAPEPGAEPGLGIPIVEPEYGNLHGVPRRTCRLCGECDMGCNDGAKNTLDHTYLSAARHHGADLRTLHEARAVRQRAGGGYEVTYARHDGTPGVAMIDCDRLILAAGTFGTMYLLLRSRSGLPGLSGALGRRFSGNGDVLTFLLRAKDRSRTREIDASQGPVITSAIRLGDRADDPSEIGRGAYIQDGGQPGFIDWVANGIDPRPNLLRPARFFVDLIWALITRDNNMSAELSRLFGDTELSSNSLPLLGMGRDVPDGRLRLRGGKLDVAWSAKASAEHFDRMRATMQRIADVLGAEHAGLPAWLGKRFITVHPLGGAPMGRHPGEGVCDAYGEVFDQPGLFIADGAAMPGPVGPNPSLTIAALADRMATRLLETKPARRGPVERSTGTPTSLSFEEEMAGFLFLGATDPRSTPVKGRSRADRLSFQLTIHIDDVDTFLARPEHLARAEGWVQADSCGGRNRVERGWFNLFVPGGGPGSREMRYRLWFTDGAGQPRTLVGWKDVHDGPATRMWHDTSTLYTRLLRGHLPPQGDDDLPADAGVAGVIGAGTLRIQPMDLAVTLKSFRAQGPNGITALAQFGRFFVGQLWDVYGPG
ncbi:GMC family oxidoreductase [Actinophytocola sp.]|uniref:GMC family oxidoreductase n=1 Tax=Actinophytocola sp. TaxID=1872138 RepID=UPI002D7FDB1F|nr:GMC family oxidoreductase [Actinophytocola sp.]HET9139503.1 GMC family oxidoreductase [Actinophytocola sp.]